MQSISHVLLTTSHKGISLPSKVHSGLYNNKTQNASRESWDLKMHVKMSVSIYRTTVYIDRTVFGYTEQYLVVL